MKIYLAGAFAPYEFDGKRYEDWRDFVRQEVTDKEFYDPREHSRQLCPATFTLDDALGVLNSDCLLHYRMRGYEDEGASWEHGIAFGVNLINQERPSDYPSKLIVFVDETNAPWPLNFSSANVNFSNLPASVEFLSKIKSINKKDWLKVYHQIIDEDRKGLFF